MRNIRPRVERIEQEVKEHASVKMPGERSISKARIFLEKMVENGIEDGPISEERVFGECEGI